MSNFLFYIMITCIACLYHFSVTKALHRALVSVCVCNVTFLCLCADESVDERQQLEEYWGRQSAQPRGPRESQRQLYAGGGGECDTQVHRCAGLSGAADTAQWEQASSSLPQQHQWHDAESMGNTSSRPRVGVSLSSSSSLSIVSLPMMKTYYTLKTGSFPKWLEFHCKPLNLYLQFLIVKLWVLRN